MPYRFRKEFRDAEIHIPGLRLKVNRFTLTQEIAEKILKKFPVYAHNIELITNEEAIARENEERVQVPELDQVGDSVDLDENDGQDRDEFETTTDEVTGKTDELKAGDKQGFNTGKLLTNKLKKPSPKANKTGGKKKRRN